MNEAEFIKDARDRTPTARLNTGTGKLLEEALQRLAHRDTEQQAEVKRLREMLAMAYSGPAKLYGDDGELTDSTESPWIDYRRDSAEQIQEKIRTRGRNALAAAIKARKEATDAE